MELLWGANGGLLCRYLVVGCWMLERMTGGKSMAFVFNIFIGYQINHFTEAAAYSVAVGLVEFGAVEVGGDVGEHSMFDEEVVAGKEDLCHDVAVVAEVFELFLQLYKRNIIE